MQAKGGLVNQGTAAETRGAVSLADVLRRLGRFLLLTHEGGSARFWELDAQEGSPSS